MRSATSSDVVKRPVAASAAAWCATASGSPPVARAIVWATPSVTEPQCRGHRPGAHRVHPDAVLRHFLGERLGEVRHGGLGRAVVEDGRVRKKGVHGARRDDGPRAGSDHRRQHGAGHPHGRHEVQVQRSGPVLVGDAQETPNRGCAAPTLLTRMSIRPCAERDRGEVGRTRRRREVHRDRLDRSRAHEGLELGGALAGSGDDVGTLVRQCARGRQSDAPAGAGDDRHLAFESELQWAPFSGETEPEM